MAVGLAAVALAAAAGAFDASSASSLTTRATRGVHAMLHEFALTPRRHKSRLHSSKIPWFKYISRPRHPTTGRAEFITLYSFF